MKRAIEKHEAGEALVIPIILRPTYWKDAPFGKLQVLPKDGKPVTIWSNRDEAFLDITTNIGEIARELPMTSHPLLTHQAIAERTKDEWLQIGDTFLDREDYEEALHAYKQAIRLDPTDAVAYNKKGITLNHLRRHQEALAAYDQAIRLDSNDAEAYLSKGIVLHMLKRYNEALDIIEQSIRLDPKRVTAYASKGFGFWYLQRYNEALAAFDQAIQLGSTDEALYKYKDTTLAAPKRDREEWVAFCFAHKGDVLRELKRYEEALAAYEHAIQLDPNNANAYAKKGDTLSKLKNKGGIVNSFRRRKEAEQAFKMARQLGYRD